MQAREAGERVTHSMKNRRLLILAFILLFSTSVLRAQDLASFEKRVTVHKLANGLTLIVLERPEAPVFSFFTLVDAGSVQDPKGLTGLAHMMEHEAFKGTPDIGSRNNGRDWLKEKAALDGVERAYAAYDYERRKEIDRDPKKVGELEKAWKEAIERAQQYVDANAYSRILDEQGQEGMNAFTEEDMTGYYYSLPANRLELWAYMESERFLHPVMREFYKERDVVWEERRMRIDNQPIGRLVEQFLSSAFFAHPYHNPGVGWPADLDSLSARDAEKFFKTYYIPSNMTIAVVGDVKAAQVIALVERYFGRIPSGPKPEEAATDEPPQSGVREIVLREQSQPFYLEGYHRPDYRDPDDNVYDVISDLLSEGRTSRLYRSLVRDKKIAVGAAGFSGLPGTKYPHLFAFYSVPAKDHTPAEQADAIHQEIERLKTQPVSDEELKMVKTRMRANLIRQLAENSGLASQLAIYQTRFGDWRELFRQLDKTDKVTAQDVQRVARKVLTESNRTVATIVNAPPKPPAAPAPAGAPNPKGGQQ
jgi:predicted Zn-dependent peptidase